MATELLLIRHAQSEWNVSGLWQGHADPPLSARGRAQAEALAEQLALRHARDGAEPIDRIECSDLRRARETAEPLASRLGLGLHTSAAYRELDIGAWEGLRRSEIAARDAALLEEFDREDPHARPPGGETRAEIRARARAAIQSLAADRPSERVVLVTHLGFIRALVPGAVPANAEVVPTSASKLLGLRRSASKGGGQPTDY